jgi:hypothetical protein
MSFCEGDSDDSPAAGFNALAPDDRVGRPIGALDEHVGLQPADDLLRRVFVEHNHGVNACETGQHFRPFVLRIERSIRPFDGAHRPVGIHTDDERVSFATCILKISHVTWMQEIEHAVGEDHFPAGVAQVLNECHGFCERENLAHNGVC